MKPKQDSPKLHAHGQHSMTAGSHSFYLCLRQLKQNRGPSIKGPTERVWKRGFHFLKTVLHSVLFVLPILLGWAL